VGDALPSLCEGKVGRGTESALGPPLALWAGAEEEGNLEVLLGARRRLYGGMVDARAEAASSAGLAAIMEVVVGADNAHG